MSRPWMPLYIGAYRKNTAHLTTAQHGAYLLLIMHYWTTGGLPDDDAQLARIVGMTSAEWRKARSVLAAFFSDGWKHSRIDDELEHAAKVSEKRRDAVNNRYYKPPTNEPTNVSPDEPTNVGHLKTQTHTHTQEEKKKEETRASALVPSDDWPPDHADQFWQLFPNKVGKAYALKCLAQARKRVSWAVMMAGLYLYVHKTDDRPWCNPSTWLNQDRWNDQPAASPRTTRDQQQQRSDDAVEQLKAFNRRRSSADSGAPDLLLPEDHSGRPKGLLGGPRGTVIDLPELGTGAHTERSPWVAGEVQVFAFDKRNQGNGG